MKPSGMTFDEAKHTYVNGVSGEMYTGCTTISGAWKKEFLMAWYAKECADAVRANAGDIAKMLETGDMKAFDGLLLECKGAAKRKSDKAKKDGTAAHAAMEAVVSAKIAGKEKFVMPELASEESKNAFNAFVKWAKGKDITWLASEELVVSHEHKVAGTLDAIAIIDGLTYLVDFKTSSQMSEDFLAQCAGYDIMLREMGLNVMGYMILRTPKDGSDCETLTITDSDDMQFFRDTFLKLREAHKFFVYMASKFKDASGRMMVDAKPKTAKKLTVKK